jgi:hypothetical protein
VCRQNVDLLAHSHNRFVPDKVIQIKSYLHVSQAKEILSLTMYHDSYRYQLRSSDVEKFMEVQ